MIIQILVDNPNSWMVSYANELKNLLGHDHTVFLLHDSNDVKVGDILCLLSCERIFTRLDLNKYNLVVHESNLPQGKGWSPLTWQVLEGRSTIAVSLFEAMDKVDSGEVYLQESIILDGSELIDELREKQGKATMKLILQFVAQYPKIRGRAQNGESSYYPRRTAEDSRLDVDMTIRDQFNLLRVVDNERYPAFFENKGIKYKIEITKF
jgi:methionyl-tRNA formyltransferase